MAKEEGVAVEELVSNLLSEQFPLREERAKVRRIVENQRRSAESVTAEEMRAYQEEMERSGQLIE